MTLTLMLPPEVERALQDNAKRQGLSLENYVLEVLKQDSPFFVDSRAFYSMTPDERARDFMAWAQSHDYITGVVDDSRESIYQGCGE